MNIQQTVEGFNNVVIDFMNQLKIVCPYSTITNNIDIISDALNSENTKNKVIDQFTYYVLKYKTQINEYDENFFIESTFEKETKGDNGLMQLMDELKVIWVKLCPDDKKKVFDYLRVLCYYSEQYFLLIS
jgi:hypothetical protein